MYDAMLPDIFLLLHVVGTVLGKATYANYLVVRQNCTIGALGYEYPVLGEKLILSAGASIIGGCRIGTNVMLGPGCTVMKEDIPDNSLVTRQGENTLKPNSDRPIQAHFSVE
jgi:serine O-acetyltransferase